MNFFYDKEQELNFFIRANLSEDTIDNMVADLEKLAPEHSLSRAAVGPYESGATSKDVRWVNIAEIPLSFWGSLILKGALLEANERFFKFDLTNWSHPLQYLCYKEGEHYKAWHSDTTESAANPSHIRKLTVLMSLSNPSDYEGGEFCFYEGRTRGNIKFQKGEIAIFPAALMHRVTPVKSGVRKMLIGWYGGPPFK